MIRIIIIGRILHCNSIIYNGISNFRCSTFLCLIHFFSEKSDESRKSVLKQCARNENTPAKYPYRRLCVTFHLRQFANFDGLISTCRSMNALMNVRGKKGAHKLSDKFRVHQVSPCCLCAIKKRFLSFPHSNIIQKCIYQRLFLMCLQASSTINTQYRVNSLDFAYRNFLIISNLNR